MNRRLIIFFICLIQVSVMLSQSGKFPELSWAEYTRVVGLLGLCVLVSPASGKRFRDFRLVDVIMAVLSLMALASLQQSSYLQASAMRLLFVALLYVAVFWTLWHFVDHAGEEPVILCLVWCMGLFLIGGLLGPLLGFTSFQSSGRFTGLMSNPNGVGLLGALVFPLVLSQVLAQRRWVDGAFLLAAAVSVLLSGSRTSAVCCACATAFVLLNARMSRALLVLLVGGGLAAVLLTIRPWESSDGFQGSTLFSNPLTRLTFQDDTLMGGGRFEIWPFAMEAIMKSPVLGHGFGTEDYWLDEENLAEEYFKIHQGKNMHNSYLGLSYQLGFTGAVVLFIPLFLLAAKSTHRLLERGFTLEHAGYTGVLLVALVAGFSESGIFYAAGNAFTFPIWTVVMLLIRRQTVERHRNVRPRTRVGAEEPTVI